MNLSAEYYEKIGVQCSLMLESSLTPLLINPINGVPVKLKDWVTNHRRDFNNALFKHGAILFRGFSIDTVEKFGDFMKCFNTDPLPYIFRSSPRSEIDKTLKHIYFSTSYPSDRSINMHNESSYSNVWGMKIIFCCLQPATYGGETPLTDSRKVLKDIDPSLIEKFREKGVKYIRNLSPGMGLSWQEVFQVTDKEIVANICRKNNISFTFKDDMLHLEWVKPAIYKHPISREELWFNHVYFFHKYSRYAELDLSHDDYLPDEYLSSHTCYGDGSEIDSEAFLEIKKAYDMNIVTFPYELGDVLFLDNMLVAHGRNPYTGSRTIATAIIEAITDDSFNYDR